MGLIERECKKCKLATVDELKCPICGEKLEPTGKVYDLRRAYDSSS